MKTDSASKKSAVIKALRLYQRENPRMNPSIRELCLLSGIASTSLMNYYLDQLEADGIITRIRGVARGIVVN